VNAAKRGSPGTTATRPQIIVRTYGVSDVGQTREHNEDSFVVANLSTAQPIQFIDPVEQAADERGTLFMVADGMGGAAAGEIASATAVDVVLQNLFEHWSRSAARAPEDFVVALHGATAVANGVIHQFASEHPEFRGMGTTATIAGLFGDTLYLAQVGDSRAYLIRQGKAIQITKDQSLMQKLIEAGEISEEEAEQSERRNIILQALGPESSVKIDMTHQRVRRGDVLVLCSDGLSSLVKPSTIAQAVTEETDISDACQRLIAIANDAGGPDNITVVAARFDGAGLEVASAGEEVGHHVFEPNVPTAEIPVSPDGQATRATAAPTPGVAPAPESSREIRGRLLLVLLSLLGVAVAAYLANQYFGWGLLGTTAAPDSAAPGAPR
jgi:PPM family protein phosphatase